MILQIWPINGTQKGTTTPSQNGPGSKDYGRVFNTLLDILDWNLDTKFSLVSYLKTQLFGCVCEGLLSFFRG